MEMEKKRNVLRVLSRFEDVAKASLGLERLAEVALDELHQGPPIEELDHCRLLSHLLALKEDLLVGEEPFEDQLQQPYRSHLEHVLGHEAETVSEKGEDHLLCPS